VLVSLIVAMDENGGIGIENRLPWRLTADMQRFKALTMGHHLVVGRKTFASIGRPLPGRKLIVVSRRLAAAPGEESLSYVGSLEEALKLAAQRGEQETFIGGGAQLYAQALACADRIYLTRVHANRPADVFFPSFDLSAWSVRETFDYPADEKNQYPSTYQALTRR